MSSCQARGAQVGDVRRALAAQPEISDESDSEQKPLRDQEDASESNYDQEEVLIHLIHKYAGPKSHKFSQRELQVGARSRGGSGSST